MHSVFVRSGWRFAMIAIGVCGSLGEASAATEGVPVEPQVLTLAFVNSCEASSQVVATAMKDTSRIWTEAGVTIRWVTTRELPYRSPLSDWLVVRCIGSAIPTSSTNSPLAIAAIRFVGSLPTNTIFASVANANALLARDRFESRDFDERFKVFRDLRLGRMLGRAIAHEVGHFLTRASAHTPSGLMRATHSVTALTGETLYAFKIDPAVFLEAANRTELPETP